MGFHWDLVIFDGKIDPAKDNLLDSFSDTNFRTPFYLLKCLKSSISIGEN